MKRLKAMQQQGENISSQAAIGSNFSTKPTILIFDSGVGGLSVYQEIRQLLPNLHYLYAFDNAGFPYGEKSESVIIERVLKMLQAISVEHHLDLIVIACNTASTITLPILREHFSIPIVGVVPAIKPAAQLTRNGIIGLLATRATVQRSYTHDLIKQFAVNCQTKLLGSARLVEIAEEKLQGQLVILDELRQILQPWLTKELSPDTIILGCTHFPLLKDELKQIFSKEVRLIDSGKAIACRVKHLLEVQENSLSSGENDKERKNIAICSQFTEQVNLLQPILERFGFEQIEEKNIHNE